MTQTEDLAQFDPASFEHIPVLLNECLDGLNIDPAGTYLDGTAGGAGNFKKESSSCICKSFSLSGDRECLARKSCTEQIKIRHSFWFNCSCITTIPLPFCVKQQSVVLIRISIHLAVSDTGKSPCTS